MVLFLFCFECSRCCCSFPKHKQSVWYRLLLLYSVFSTCTSHIENTNNCCISSSFHTCTYVRLVEGRTNNPKVMGSIFGFGGYVLYGNETAVLFVWKRCQLLAKNALVLVLTTVIICTCSWNTVEILLTHRQGAGLVISTATQKCDPGIHGDLSQGQRISNPGRAMISVCRPCVVR